MMSPAELKTLAEDIQANGLIEPIVLHEDMVLDGRNRLAACGMAGVEPRFEDANLNGRSPTLFVVSKNLHRRHLTTSQRAAISTNLLPLLQEEARARMGDGGKKHGAQFSQEGSPKTDYLPAPLEMSHIRGQSAALAAKVMQVGRTAVYNAAAIARKSPEQLERIKRGETTVGRAYKEATAKPGRKHQAVRTPGKRQQMRERAAKQRMVEVLSHIRGMCKGVTEMNIPLLIASMTKDERRAWIRIGYEAARQLREFARKLGEGEHEEQP